MNKRKRTANAFLFVLLSLLAVLFVSPIIIVFINSFKTKFNIISEPF